MILIKNLKPNKDNPREITPKALEQLKTSIEKFERMLSIRPMVVDEDNVILGGNMRYHALKELGYTEVPDEWVKQEKGLTEDQKREFVIKDNLSFGMWDEESLFSFASEEELEGWGMDLSKFKGPDIIDNLGATDPDDVPDIPKAAKTKLGDMYVLGDHLLICGDSTDHAVVKKLTGGKKCEMCFTDPPYLMDFKGNVSWDEKDGAQPTHNAKHGGIKNDKMSKVEGEAFLDDINKTIQAFVEGAFYITFYRLGIGQYFASLDRLGMQVRSLIIWNKGNHTLSNSDYMSMYEPIFYVWVDKHDFQGGKNGRDIWDIDRTKKNDLHPTMKPVELCEKAIRDSSKNGATVLDLFGGSGSTLIACEKSGRKARVVELDEKYCDVIVARWEEYTGKKAKLVKK